MRGSLQLSNDLVMKQIPLSSTTVNIDGEQLSTLKLHEIFVFLFQILGPDGFIPPVRELINKLKSD